MVYLCVGHAVDGFEGRMGAVMNFALMAGSLSRDGDHQWIAIILVSVQISSCGASRPLSDLCLVFH